MNIAISIWNKTAIFEYEEIGTIGETKRAKVQTHLRCRKKIQSLYKHLKVSF